MKFLKHTVWSLIVASMMTACMGFDEINVDPDKTNRPTPGMLATQVLFSMMDSRSNSSEGFANHCMLSKHIACGEKIRDYAYNRIGRTGFGAYTSLIEAEKWSNALPRSRSRLTALWRISSGPTTFSILRCA